MQEKNQNNIYKTSGQKIKYFRELFDLSQADLAEQLNISRGQATVSEWERDLYAPNKTMLEKFFEEFLVSSTWLTKSIGPIIEKISNTTFASNIIINKLPRTNKVLELHYKMPLNNYTINHALELHDKQYRFVFSDMNLDRSPRWIEMKKVRSKCVEKGISILHLKTDEETINKLAHTPDKLKFINLFNEATYEDPDKECLKWYEEKAPNIDRTMQFGEPNKLLNKHSNTNQLLKEAEKILLSNTTYSLTLENIIKSLSATLKSERKD